MISIQPRGVGRSARTPNSFITTSLPKAGTSRRGSSRNFSRKRFARALGHCAEVKDADDAVVASSASRWLTGARRIPVVSRYVVSLSLPLSAKGPRHPCFGRRSRQATPGSIIDQELLAARFRQQHDRDQDQAIGEQCEEADGEAEAERRAEIADEAGKQRA